ncbi:hypothetical protein D779_0721 [Imhoffiella purpurea]|uniref:Uncharacterized protein n=1 Tax=Imhoffiella purpurea TaxID=1249627 RepID=W9V8Q2_9GAMM|nr:hypothetical protein D779_0721 [Imhoffiella purpurea]
MHVGTPARSVQLFENRDPIAARAEPNRRRQTADATADDERMGLFRATRNLWSRNCQVRITRFTVNIA